MSTTTDQLLAMSAELIDAWDNAGRGAVETAIEGGAELQSLTMPRRPRGGLAIGRGINPQTRKPRLEMRVTAGKGPNFALATQLARQAELQGVDVLLKSLKNSIMGRPVPPHAVLGGRRQPLHVGASIANRQSMAGTLGAFVNLPDGEIGVLSCGHVLARAGKKWGVAKNPVHQPGQPEENPVLDANRVGELTKLFAPFVDSQVNNLDAAVARLDPDCQHQGNILADLACVPPELRGSPIGPPLAVGELGIGARICKLGRTTGFTEATISALDFQNLRAQVGTGGSANTFTFSGVYEVLWDENTPFAAGGDSGSLVMTREGLHPIGLHFAAIEGEDGNWVSYVVPLPLILSTFGITLVR